MGLGPAAEGVVADGSRIGDKAEEKNNKKRMENSYEDINTR